MTKKALAEKYEPMIAEQTLKNEIAEKDEQALV